MKVSIVCGANASRSQTIEEFLKKACRPIPNLQIKSYGTNVVKLDELGDKDRRTQFTQEEAEQSDIIFVADHYNLYMVNKLLGKKSGQVHLLRIPDVFYIHRNAYPCGKGLLEKAVAYSSYETDMKNITDKNPDVARLRDIIESWNPREASIFIEAVYTKELNKSHLPQSKQNYPFELLYKTLEFRFPWMLNIIMQKYSK